MRASDLSDTAGEIVVIVAHSHRRLSEQYTTNDMAKLGAPIWTEGGDSILNYLNIKTPCPFNPYLANVENKVRS